MTDFKNLFQRAHRQNLITPEDDATIFYDLSALKERIIKFEALFPSQHLHTVAIKTCPLSAILSEIGKTGFGHEAASVAEVLLAAQASDAHIVYDGPAKRKEELELILPLKDRLLINANSLQDLKKISPFPFPHIGLRINTQVQTRVNDIFDVSQRRSKFGVSIKRKEEIIEAFSSIENLDSLHFHLGSGMNNITPFVNALTLLDELCQAIEVERKKVGFRPLSNIDIGGGLLAELPRKELQKAKALGQVLQNDFGHLWDKYTLITEMGQYFHTQNAWVCTKISDVIHHKSRPTIIAQTGANMFPRQAYTSTPPPFAYSILGAAANAPLRSYDIAGPLCFAGDIVAENISLPETKEGDCLVIDAVGANTFSLYSMHCSWPFPKVIGYESEGQNMRIVKERMGFEQLIAFWS
jgi:diaminopimelate decarboxylase